MLVVLYTPCMEGLDERLCVMSSCKPKIALYMCVYIYKEIVTSFPWREHAHGQDIIKRSESEVQMWPGMP